MNKQAFFDMLRHLDVAQFEVSYYQVRELEVPRSTAFVIVSGGDGLVDKANRQTFEAEYQDAINAIPLETVGKDLVAVEEHMHNPAESEHYDSLVDWVEALANYPLANEEKHSELELEAIEESWNDWVARDFVSALSGLAESELLSDILSFGEEPDGVLNDALRNLFNAAAAEANEYWEESSDGGMSIRPERVALEVDRDMLIEHLAATPETQRFVAEAVLDDWGRTVVDNASRNVAIQNAAFVLSRFEHPRLTLQYKDAKPLLYPGQGLFHLAPVPHYQYQDGGYYMPAIAVMHSSGQWARCFHVKDIALAADLLLAIVDAGMARRADDDREMYETIAGWLKARNIPVYHDGKPLGGDK